MTDPKLPRFLSGLCVACVAGAVASLLLARNYYASWVSSPLLSMIMLLGLTYSLATTLIAVSVVNRFITARGSQRNGSFFWGAKLVVAVLSVAACTFALIERRPLGASGFLASHREELEASVAEAGTEGKEVRIAGSTYRVLRDPIIACNAIRLRYVRADSNYLVFQPSASLSERDRFLGSSLRSVRLLEDRWFLVRTK